MIDIVDALSRNQAPRGFANLGAPYYFVFDLLKEEYIFFKTSRYFLNSGLCVEEVLILLILYVITDMYCTQNNLIG